MARPFTSRLYARTDQRSDERIAASAAAIELRLSGLDAQVTGFAADLAAFSRYLPTVMNTIASQNASARDQERRLGQAQSDVHSLSNSVIRLDGTVQTLAEGLAYLEKRNEFIRAEVMFEQRYGGSPIESRDRIEPEILNEEKLLDMGQDIRLNVGAGHIPVDGYLNVDFRPLPGIDVVADIKELPFEPGELTEIYSSHVLEHFSREELRRSILPSWISLLKDGGTLVAILPDLQSMVDEVAAGRMPFDQFVGVVYGGQEYEGDFHFAGYSQDSLVELLEEAGFTEVKVREFGRRNGDCLEMEVEATRRLSPLD